MTPAPIMAVLGGGLLGQAVARVAAAGGADVRLWARRPEARAALAKSLVGVSVVDEVAAACGDAAVVALAVPASGLREVSRSYGEVARGDQFVLHAVRGVCPGDGFTLPHQVIRAESCVRKVGVLGGPLYAPDLTGDRPLAVVVASRFDETPAMVRALTDGTPVRVHATRDIVGVEVAGAMSNVAALATGMADALELGDTARGVLLTRSLGEAARLGVALGAQAATFAGLAGVGDLIPRRVASTERHHRVGGALAVGRSLADAMAEQEGEVEGILTAERALVIADRMGVDLVLARAVHGVCIGDRGARDALEGVLQRHLDLGRGLGV